MASELHAKSLHSAGGVADLLSVPRQGLRKAPALNVGPMLVGVHEVTNRP